MRLGETRKAYALWHSEKSKSPFFKGHYCMSFDSRRPAACPRDPVRTRVIPSIARDLSVSRRSLGVKNTPRDDTGSRGQAAGRQSQTNRFKFYRRILLSIEQRILVPQP